MGYTPNLNDPSSPYYYGTDSTWKPQGRKPQPPKSRPVIELDFYGVPTVVKPGATAQPPESSGGSGNVVNMGGKSYNMSEPKQKAAYEKSQQEELARQRARSPMADIRGGDGQKPDGTGRFSTRTSPTGVVQTGTQTSLSPMTMDDANRLLTGGYQVMNPFASNHLPASATDLYGTNGYQAPKAEDIPQNMYAVKPKTMGKNLDMDLGPFDLGNAPEYPVAGMQIQSEMLRGSPNIANGGAAETAVVTESATSTPKTSIPKRPRGERAGEMWDRKYGRRTQSTSTSETKGSGIDYKRRAAFLDAPNSLQGLRRVEAQKGVVYAGGQHNIVNPNRGQDGENDFIKISKEDRDSYMRGDQGAQDLKAKYVDKITAANAGQDGNALVPTDVLQEQDISFESPAPANPMKTALENAPTNLEAPPNYFGETVKIKSKDKKYGF